MVRFAHVGPFLLLMNNHFCLQFIHGGCRDLKYDIEKMDARAAGVLMLQNVPMMVALLVGSHKYFLFI